MQARLELGRVLAAAGRYAEALRMTVAVIREHADLAEAPRNYFRYNSACFLLNCTDGLWSNPLPQGEHPAFRKEALALLTAELAAVRKLAAAEAAHVHWYMQYWLSDKDLESVRESKALGQLPMDERDAWNKLWREVRILRDQTAPQASPRATGRRLRERHFATLAPAAPPPTFDANRIGLGLKKHVSDVLFQAMQLRRVMHYAGATGFRLTCLAS